MARFSRRQAQEGSKYVDDNRGQRSSGGFGGLGGSPRRSGGGGGKAIGGIGGVIVAIIAALFGITTLSGGGGGSFDVSSGGLGSGNVNTGAVATSVVQNLDEEVSCDADTEGCMMAAMDDIQDVWSAIFDQAGLQYQFTRLNLFTGSTDTAGCGRANSQVGPFYCPAPQDMEVYIDLDFLFQLQRQLGARGDFAQLYVVAHEVGHHLQSVLGISDQVRQLQSQNPGSKNDLAIRMELQADCFAGVWGFYASQRTSVTEGIILDTGDIREGLDAAGAVGDDRIQEQSGFGVNPETWTHGSAEQREDWFRRGLAKGDPEACDTFAVDNP